MARSRFPPTLALALLLAAPSVATEITFSPSPPVAGQPFTVTFHGVEFACEDVGQLEVVNIAANRILLEVTPPNCPIIPVGVVEYTATAAVGPLAAGVYQFEVFEAAGGVFVLQGADSVEVKAAPACSATDTSLCLGGGRFEVTGEWTDFEGHQGEARAMPDGFDGLGDWGVLWFFSTQNPEMLVKLIDACALNGHHWVFLSPASTVEYTITVRDARTGAQRTYGNGLGQVPALTADTRAFPCA
jgi:hypothetical protein